MRAPSLTTPAAGDGGTIFIGGNSMTEYDPTDPFDGSIISNADISYMTRIEVQGGGIVNTYNDITGTPGTPTLSSADWWDQLAGYLAPVDQLNSAMSLTISDSNLADFSSAAVFVHPGPAGRSTSTGRRHRRRRHPVPFPTRDALIGQPVYLYMYNDTVSNSAQGVHINSRRATTRPATASIRPSSRTSRSITTGIGIQTQAPAWTRDPDNELACVEVLAMNDIFDGSSNDAVTWMARRSACEGRAAFSQLQYNLFYNNTTNVVSTTNDGDFEGNEGASFGNPEFVGPVGAGLDATAENFELEPNSPAIDAGRSEIGPLAGGNAIYPGTNLSLSGGQVIGTRTNPYTLPNGEVPGKSDPFGEFGEFFQGGFNLQNLVIGSFDPRQIVTLPGSGYFSYPDQWQPVLAGTVNGYSGPSSNADTYDYQPYSGVRDILGYIRVARPRRAGRRLR